MKHEDAHYPITCPSYSSSIQQWFPTCGPWTIGSPGGYSTGSTNSHSFSLSLTPSVSVSSVTVF